MVDLKEQTFMLSFATELGKLHKKCVKCLKQLSLTVPWGKYNVSVNRCSYNQPTNESMCFDGRQRHLQAVSYLTV
jgi:hypothetical protein